MATASEVFQLIFRFCIREVFLLFSEFCTRVIECQFEVSSSIVMAQRTSRPMHKYYANNST